MVGRDIPFHWGGTQRNSIAATLVAAKSSGFSDPEAATRCFAFIEAHLSRRSLSNLTPSSGHTVSGIPTEEINPRCVELWDSLFAGICKSFKFL